MKISNKNRTKEQRKKLLFDAKILDETGNFHKDFFANESSYNPLNELDVFDNFVIGPPGSFNPKATEDFYNHINELLDELGSLTGYTYCDQEFDDLSAILKLATLPKTSHSTEENLKDYIKKYSYNHWINKFIFLFSIFVVIMLLI